MKLASVNPMFYDFGMDLDALMARPEVIIGKTLDSNICFYQCLILFFFIEIDGIFVSDMNIQRLSGLTSPVLPSLQQCSPSQPTAYADTTTTFIATNNYPVMDTSASLLFQQGQRLNVFSQVILSFFFN